MATYTTASVTSAERLCKEATGMPQNKAALAAMMAEAFINGMNAQQVLTPAPSDGKPA